jgi:hypothetical protein
MSDCAFQKKKYKPATFATMGAVGDNETNCILEKRR